ncbi:MAG TPA: hypothetical protein VGJ84_21190, partial [Polyangiaceae bacterium]
RSSVAGRNKSRGTSQQLQLIELLSTSLLRARVARVGREPSVDCADIRRALWAPLDSSLLRRAARAGEGPAAGNMALVTDS